MADMTPGRQLPYLIEGQHDPDVTIAEVLHRLDGGGIWSVLDVTATPPGAPVEGDWYVVAAAATGAWIGHDGQLAGRYGGAWIYLTPRNGWMVIDLASARVRVHMSGAWLPANATPDLLLGAADGTPVRSAGVWGMQPRVRAGTWTPSFGGSGGDPAGVTPLDAIGRYWVGDGYCTIECELSASVITTPGTGQLWIRGAPVSAANPGGISGYYGMLGAYRGLTLPSGFAQVSVRIAAGSTIVSVQRSGSGQAPAAVMWSELATGSPATNRYSFSLRYPI